jgi:hypothetical protein
MSIAQDLITTKEYPVQCNMATENITNKQMAGGYLSPDWAVNPDEAEPYLKQAAEAGFLGYILFVRHMKQSITEPRVVKAVARITEIAHRHGLKLLLDTETTWWAANLVEAHPEAALWRICPMQAKARKGHVRVGLEKPKKSQITRYEEVSAVYIQSEGEWKRVPADGFTADWQGNMLDALDGHGLTIEVKLSEAYTGPIRLYISISQKDWIDFAHPAYHEMMKSILDSYAHIPLDGVTWDEPGKGHDSLKAFAAGEGLLKLFEDTHGYDLREKLIYLDLYDGTAEAVRVRTDYFQALSDMHYNGQKFHNDYAKKLWGDDIILGTHQTYSGLPLDLGCGVMDHFRLGEVLSAAWTDGGISFERKIHIFPLMLADSIKKELKLRDAYYNDWFLQPWMEQILWFNRLKTLWHINTFAHVYSEPLEYHVNMRWPEFSKPFEADIKLQDSVDTFIGEQYSDTDIAIWYGWEGYAALPKWGARAVYTFFMNTSLLLTDTGLFGDYVSNKGLAGATVEDGRMIINDQPYKVVIIPYAHALPEEIYTKLIDAAKQGVKVVFVGPPPEFSLKNRIEGKATAATALDFCKTIGVEDVTFADFEDVINERDVVIDSDSCEPTHLEILCPVELTTATAMRDVLGAITVVKAADSDLYWLPSLDPRDDLSNLIAPWCEGKVEVFSRNAYHRTFSSDKAADDFVLVLAPREGMPGWGIIPEALVNRRASLRPPNKPLIMDALVKLGDKQWRVTGGAWCALRIQNGEIVESLADDAMKMEAL